MPNLTYNHHWDNKMRLLSDYKIFYSPHMYERQKTDQVFNDQKLAVTFYIRIKQAALFTVDFVILHGPL